MKNKKQKSYKLRKIIAILLVLIVICYGGRMVWAATTPSTTIVCEDNNLYQSLKSILPTLSIINKDDSTKTLEVATSTIQSITELNLNSCGITNLTGIEKFTALTDLDLAANSIENISVLSELTNLSKLDLSGNKIEDIQDISSLVNLLELNLSSNKISSATAVKSMNNLTKLNISNNSSFSNLSDVLMPQLISLCAADTAVTDIEEITMCTALKELDLGNNSITTLAPLFQTEKIDNNYVAILRGIEKLDLENTTKTGLSFSNLKKITALKELYLQNNELTSVSGIAQLENLEYVNLDDNNISSIADFIETKLKNGKRVITARINAIQISMQNNKISDIGVFTYLNGIQYLNLAENQIEDISVLENFDFSGGLDLRNQEIDLKIYKKKNDEDHYIILPNIMQSAKDPSSVAYNENATFTTENVILNEEEIYNQAPYYNVIITPNKTRNDTLSITLHGGVADGTKINFSISSSPFAIETLRFEDDNVDQAIYDCLKNNLESTILDYLIGIIKGDSYIARAPHVINIAHNKIADITELDLSNHNIQNIQGLSNFINLKTLNLANNKITNDSEIEYLTKLETLNLANNKLDNNYTSIEKLYSLQNLNLEGNNIQDLDSLSDLIENLSRKNKICNLIKLGVAHNDISDISILSSISTLRNLDISNNEIKDISAISNLSLTTLNISGNLISDITPIKNMINLTDLYINNNKIHDISSVESLLLKNTFEAKQQKIVGILEQDSKGTVSVELPQIFVASQNTNSKVYTSNEFKVNNCELSADGNSIQINVDELKEKIATIAIVGGQADGTTLSIVEAPTARIEYDKTDNTNQDVVATISFNKTGINILNNNGNNTYTFTQNGEFIFKYQDEYGFSGEAKAEVTWIDKEGPEGTVTYSVTTPTNEDVVVTISSNEEIYNAIDGWTFANEEHTKITKKYGENIEKDTIIIKDKLENSSTVDIVIQNIDKVLPIITGVENGKTYETSVTPKAEDQNLESVTLTKDGKQVSNYKNNTEIKENGKYVVIAKDTASNTTTVEFTIEKKVIDDSITSKKYMVDDTLKEIKQVSPNTTVDSFKKNIETEVGYKIVNSKNIEIKSNDLVGTGCKIVTDTKKEYVIIVKGDLNGDGKLSLSDVTKIRKHILKIDLLQNEFEKAADVNNSNSTTLSDVTIMRKVILELETI